jgi:hypothetical protein
VLPHLQKLWKSHRDLPVCTVERAVGAVCKCCVFGEVRILVYILNCFNHAGKLSFLNLSIISLKFQLLYVAVFVMIAYT